MKKNLSLRVVSWLMIFWGVGFLAGLFLLFAPGFKCENGETVISLVVVLVITFLIVLYRSCRLHFYQYTFIVIMIVGVVTALVQPILNVPDERTHFAAAEIVSRKGIFIDKSGDLDNCHVVFDMDNECQKPVTHTKLYGEKPNLELVNSDYAKQTIKNSLFLYVPQAIGIFIAKGLRLNAIWLLWLGRIVNLLVYSCCISFAVMIAKEYAEVVFFLSVLPMSIQQAASLSTDALINGLTLLYIALFVRYYCDEHVSKKRMIIFWGLSFVITVIKITNICMAGLLLILPFPNNISKRKEVLTKIVCVLSVIIVGIVLFWLKTSVDYEPYASLIENNVDSSEQIKFIISNFYQWIHSFGYSMMVNSEMYLVSLSSFGWFQVPFQFLSVILLFWFGKICFENPGIKLNKCQRVLILLMTLGTYVLTGLALYLMWTPVGATYVEGVQGRYYIPMLGLIPMIFLQGRVESTDSIQPTIDVRTIYVSLLMVGAMLLLLASFYYT